MGDPAEEDLGRFEAFTYLTVPERAAYLAIMRLFTGSLMTDLSAHYVESITEEIVLLAPRIERHLERSWPHLPGVVTMLRDGGLAGAAAGLRVAVQHSRGHEMADWIGLRAWFSDVDGRRSEVTQLRDATMRALQSLLANAKRMIRSAGQGASRRRELLRLAAWLDAADEDTAADLFTAAFGLYPARHLGLAADAQVTVPATTSWWPAPAVEVPVALRDRGVRAARGRVSGIADRSAQQQALIAQAAEAQRLRAAAAAELISAAADLVRSGCPRRPSTSCWNWWRRLSGPAIRRSATRSPRTSTSAFGAS